MGIYKSGLSVWQRNRAKLPADHAGDKEVIGGETPGKYLGEKETPPAPEPAPKAVVEEKKEPVAKKTTPKTKK